MKKKPRKEKEKEILERREAIDGRTTRVRGEGRASFME